MRCMVAVAVGHDDGSYVRRRLSPDGFEALNELAVRETGVDQDGRCPGLQEKRVPLAPAT